VFLRIKGKEYRPAIQMVIEAARRAGMEDEALGVWFDGMSADTIRARLHSWRLWEEYCRSRGITVTGMQELVNPAVVMANFLAYIQSAKVSEKWRCDARPAVLILLDLLLPGINVADNSFLKSMFRSVTVRVRRISKFRDIWSLGLVLDYIRNGRPLHCLLGRN
jgi:hypothetical protein